MEHVGSVGVFVHLHFTGDMSVISFVHIADRDIDKRMSHYTERWPGYPNLSIHKWIV